jgi:hypothetical protein
LLDKTWIAIIIAYFAIGTVYLASVILGNVSYLKTEGILFGAGSIAIGIITTIFLKLRTLKHH